MVIGRWRRTGVPCRDSWTERRDWIRRAGRRRYSDRDKWPAGFAMRRASISRRPLARPPFSIIIPLEFPRRPVYSASQCRPPPVGDAFLGDGDGDGRAVGSPFLAAAAGWFVGSWTGAGGPFIDWCRRRTPVEAASGGAAGPGVGQAGSGYAAAAGLDDDRAVDRRPVGYITHNNEPS